MPDDRVIVVVDRDYGPQLRLLPEEIPAWVVDSPANHEIIADLWSSRRRWKHTVILTSFIDRAELSREECVIAMLDTIELHHSAWNVARIIGAEAAPQLVEAMRTLGFVVHRVSRDGLEFWKHTPLPL